MIKRELIIPIRFTQLYKSRKNVVIFILIATTILLNMKNIKSNNNLSIQKVCPNIVLSKWQKYITSKDLACDGIGNQMFRYASLYGIGSFINRSIYIPSDSKCYKESLKEIKKTFPNLHNILQIFQPKSDEILQSDFGLDCCKFQDPTTLHIVPQKYLFLNGRYFHSYKYFANKEKEIKYMFDFHSDVKNFVNEHIKLNYQNITSHKLCVHIRRTDFLEHQQMESRAEFIEPSISFLFSYLKESTSLIFIGDDMKFAKTLKFNQSKFVSIHFLNFNSWAEDMYFGIQMCDTLLLTASGSTFAWWIGYFLPKQKNVFYNAQISKNRNYQKDYYDFDCFPPEWKMLELNKTSKTVKIDNRWFYERFSWPKNGIPPLF